MTTCSLPTPDSGKLREAIRDVSTRFIAKRPDNVSRQFEFLEDLILTAIAPFVAQGAAPGWQADGTPTDEQRERDMEHFRAWIDSRVNKNAMPERGYVWNAACAYARRLAAQSSPAIPSAPSVQQMAGGAHGEHLKNPPHPFDAIHAKPAPTVRQGGGEAACEVCGGSGVERALGRDNDEIITDCSKSTPPASAEVAGTPETDEAVNISSDPEDEYVLSSFSRRLERQRDEARRENAQLLKDKVTEERMRRTMESAHGEILSECVKLRAQLAQLNSALEEFGKRVQHGHGYIEELKDKIEALTAANEELAKDKERDAMPIDESLLLLLGFEKGSNVFGGEEYRFALGIEDVSPHEQAAILVQRGNGSDPECWDIRFFAWRGELNGGKSITLKYGARRIGEITQLIKVLHFDAARNPAKETT